MTTHTLNRTPIEQDMPIRLVTWKRKQNFVLIRSVRRTRLAAVTQIEINLFCMWRETSNKTQKVLRNLFQIVHLRQSSFDQFAWIKSYVNEMISIHQMNRFSPERYWIASTKFNQVENHMNEILDENLKKNFD